MKFQGWLCNVVLEGPERKKVCCGLVLAFSQREVMHDPDEMSSVETVISWKLSCKKVGQLTVQGAESRDVLDGQV